MLLALLGWALVGLVLGLLGSGATLLAVPVCKEFCGFALEQAINNGLFGVGLICLLAAVLAWWHGQVPWRAMGLFLLVSNLGAGLAGRWGGALSSQVKLGVLFWLMTWALWNMAKKLWLNREAQEEQGPTSLGVMIVFALIVGFSTGLVGVGGGFMIVPILLGYKGIEMDQAIAASYWIIGCNSVLALWQKSAWDSIHLAFLGKMLAVAVFGLVIGLLVRSSIPERIKRIGFMLLLLLLASRIFWQLIQSFF